MFKESRMAEDGYLRPQSSDGPPGLTPERGIDPEARSTPAIPLDRAQPPPSSLGERITRVRTALGTTMRDLADQVGVSVAAVWKWEHGSLQPRPEHVDALAVALHLSVTELLDEPHPLRTAILNQSRGRIAAVLQTSPEKVRIAIDD